MLAEAIHPAPDMRNGRTMLDMLNAIPVAPAQIKAALEVLAMLPAAVQREPVAQAQALQAYARVAGFADDVPGAAALHARVTALAKWTAAHDPGRQSDAHAVIEATARYALDDLAVSGSSRRASRR